jgi:hypothetical protein
MTPKFITGQQHIDYLFCQSSQMINMDERDVFPEMPEAPAPEVPIQEFMASRLFWLFMKIYILKAIMRFLFWILENHNQSSQAQE